MKSFKSFQIFFSLILSIDVTREAREMGAVYRQFTAPTLANLLVPVPLEEKQHPVGLFPTESERSP